MRPSTPGRMFSAGMRQSSKASCDVTEARSDILPLCSKVEKPLRALLDEEAAHHAVELGPDDGHVGDRAVGDPGLGAVQDVGVAVLPRRVVRMPPGFEPKSGSVRPKQPIASALASFGIQWSFCCLRAEGVDRVHDEARLHRDERAQAGVAALELLHDQAVGDVVEAGQAVFGDRRAEEAHLGHLRDELPREAAFPGGLLDDREDLVVDPGAHGVADHALVLGQESVEVEVVGVRSQDEPSRKGRNPIPAGPLPGSDVRFARPGRVTLLPA